VDKTISWEISKERRIAMELEVISLEELEVLEEPTAPGTNTGCGLWC